KRPPSGWPHAETAIKIGLTSDTRARPQPNSSVIGLSINPKAKREPPLTNNTVQPRVSINQLGTPLVVATPDVSGMMFHPYPGYTKPRHSDGAVATHRASLNLSLMASFRCHRTCTD